DPIAGMGKSINKSVGGILGGFGNALDDGAPPPAAGKLTAEWIEYELRIPGQPSRKLRRQAFDLVGPAARAAGNEPVIGEAQKVTRGLSLLGTTEVLSVPCAIA